MNVRYLEPDEFGLWDDFVNASPLGTIFHTSQWLEILANWQNLVLKVAVCYKGNELMGGMAYTSKKKFGTIPVMQMPAKTPFFSPVLGPSKTKYLSKTESQQHSILHALLDLITEDVKHFHAQFPPGFRDIRPFKWKGFRSKVHYTYRTALSDERICAHFDPAIRRQIKKAELLDYHISSENSADHFNQAWDLEQNSFKRQNLSYRYASREQFGADIEFLSKKGIAQSYVIRYEDRTVASQVIIIDPVEKVAYYWLAGADENYLSTGLNQLLLCRVLSDLIEKGCKNFDFVGADTESIARYKSTFNFPLVPMYSVSKSSGIARYGMWMKKLVQ